MAAAAPRHTDEKPAGRTACRGAHTRDLLALRKHNAAVLRAIPDLILVLDRRGRILDCNHNQDLFELDIDECLGRTVEDLLPGQTAARLLDHVRRALESDTLQVFENRCSLLHYRQRHCEFRLVAMDERQVMVIIRDITERRKVETALRVGEERYRLLVETMNEGLVALNPEGRITFVNPAFSALSGRRRTELLGSAVQDLLPAESRHRYMRAIRNPAAPATHPFRVSFTTNRGRRRHALVSPRPLYDDAGNLRGSLSVFSDITDLVRTTRRLQKREDELENKSRHLEESNIALKVLLKRKLEDEDELKNDVLQNVKELVHPYIDKLRRSRLNANQQAHLDTLAANLEEIVSPFVRNLTSGYLRLTPQEIRIANYIRQGRTTKEIADSLNLSPRTVDAHRNSIRRKLGINKKRVHLQTYLQSMSDEKRL